MKWWQEHHSNQQRLLHYPSICHPIISSHCHVQLLEKPIHTRRPSLLFGHYQLLLFWQAVMKHNLDLCSTDDWHYEFPRAVKSAHWCQTRAKPQWPARPIIKALMTGLNSGTVWVNLFSFYETHTPIRLKNIFILHKSNTIQFSLRPFIHTGAIKPPKLSCKCPPVFTPLKLLVSCKRRNWDIQNDYTWHSTFIIHGRALLRGCRIMRIIAYLFCHYTLSNKTGAVIDKCLCCRWLHAYKTVIW